MVDNIDDMFPRPDWVRRINLMGKACGGAENLIAIDADELITVAKKSTGLNDFGENIDGDWKSRFYALINLINQDAKLNVLGRLLTKQELLRCLRSRLFLTQKIKDYPAITDEKIAEPIIIVGTGRSGTSILLQLMSLDENYHVPYAWKGIYPATDIDDADDLLELGECEEELLMDIVPELSVIHESRSALPEECTVFQKPSFSGWSWQYSHDIPSYEKDQDAAMQFHKLAMQAIQYGSPQKTWILKEPSYLDMMEVVFKHFPDAWIILNHRDPMKTVPSTLPLIAANRRVRSDYCSVDDLAEYAVRAPIEIMLQVHQQRKSGEIPDRFVDLHFKDLMSNPVATIKNCYEAMGRAFDDSHAIAIEEYLRTNPRGKHGSYRYSLKDWHIDEEIIKAGTKNYVDIFGIAVEV